MSPCSESHTLHLQGYNVLHPIGWDAFGLPAEQYAIQTGTHPRVTTEKNINRFRQQLQSLGKAHSQASPLTRVHVNIPDSGMLSHISTPNAAPPHVLCALPCGAQPLKGYFWLSMKYVGCVQASHMIGTEKCPQPAQSTTSGRSGSSASCSSGASRTRPRCP